MKTAYKWFVFTGIPLALIIIIIGFSVDFKGYLGNILAEIAGLIISILVALFIVDRFTQHQNEKRWEKVRHLTHQAIASHLNNIIIETINHFPIKDHNPIIMILDRRNQPNSNIIKAIDDILDQLKQLSQQEQLTSKIAVEYYNAIKWDISHIRLDLIPRVIQSSDDQNLIEALIDFDDAVQELQSTIILHKQLIKRSVFSNILVLLEKIKVIYELLIKRW